MEKISQVEGHFTIFFLCPRCSAPNTNRLNKEHLQFIPMSHCHYCRQLITLDELLGHYGPLNYPKLHFHCIEYICDECGETNLIKNDIKREGVFVRPSQDPSELWKPPEERPQEHMYISGSQVPEHVVCRHCGQRHNVTY